MLKIKKGKTKIKISKHVSKQIIKEQLYKKHNWLSIQNK